MAVVFLAELIIVIFFYRLGPLRMALRDMGLTFSVPRLFSHSALYPGVVQSEDQFSRRPE